MFFSSSNFVKALHRSSTSKHWLWFLAQLSCLYYYILLIVNDFVQLLLLRSLNIYSSTIFLVLVISLLNLIDTAYIGLFSGFNIGTPTNYTLTSSVITKSFWELVFFSLPSSGRQRVGPNTRNLQNYLHLFILYIYIYETNSVRMTYLN